MGNQFDNVKAEACKATMDFMDSEGMFIGHAETHPHDNGFNSKDMDLEIIHRWNLFPKLVKALMELTDDSHYDFESMKNARALLREAKE